ncbi:MAG TPA: hypothetical protein VEZ47_12100 [Gemmatirosa sp.]|nr:hypothetical protein [Gemmatirosa sp.]
MRSRALHACTVAVAAITLVAAPAAARAQQAPNLSGTWELDVAQSDFGMMPGPTKATLVVEHKEPALKVVSTQVTPRGERTATSSYTTDGKESKNTGAMGNEVVSTLRWDGAVLTNASKTQMQGTEVGIAERWTVAPDGKTLTIARTLQAPMGEMQMKVVYVKQP